MQRLTFIFFSLLLVVLISGAVIGCDSGKDQKPKAMNPPAGVCSANANRMQDPGVFGGQRMLPGSSFSTSIVALIGKNYRSGKQLCTGILIDRNVILTAAHCVDPYILQSVSAVFSTAPRMHPDEGENYPELERRVSKRIVHKGYSILSGELKGDLAMIRFDGDLPAGYVPMKLADQAIFLAENTQVVVAGYGVRSDYNEKPGAPIYLNSASVKPYYGCVSVKSGRQLDSAPTIYLDQRNGQGACAGDSGGPSLLYTKNGFRVIGIASAVDPLEDRGFKTRDDVTCRKGIIYTSVIYYRGWIENSFDQLRDLDSEVESPFDR